MGLANCTFEAPIYSIQEANVGQSIVRATEQDISVLDKIFRSSITGLCANDYPSSIIEPWANSVKAESRLKAIAEGKVWIGLHEGNAAGYLVAIPGEIVALFISEEYAGRGVGKRLANLGLELAGGTKQEVVVESTITAAPFYEGLGFSEISRGYFSHGDHGLEIPIVNMMRLPA